MTTYLGKSYSFGFPRVPFVNCRQFMYLVISLLVLRAGCGIWLYQFLIIAYLFTLLWTLSYAQPRRAKTCLVTELYDIKSLSEEHRTKLVDMENYFCDDGNPVFRYYGKDKIHLSVGNTPAVGFHRKVSWLCNFGRELRGVNCYMYS